ncbi:MAG: hypothetical protein ABR968_12175 [Bacteroidales bacterium]
MNSFEIIKLQCPSCGDSLDDEGKGEAKCKHCGTISIIIPPAKSNLNNLNINEEWKLRLKNILFSIEQSISAGNFIDAKNFCDKGLEIESSLGSLWENKAICAFWITKTEDIIETGAQEIFSYLKTAKLVEPNSTTFKSTAEKIFINLYNCLLSQLENIYDTTNKYIYTKEDYIEVIKIMNFMELCYDKYPDINLRFIDYILKEYSDNNKMIWTEQWSNGAIKTEKNVSDRKVSFNPAEKYLQLIEKVKKNHPNYNLPKIKLQKNYYTTIAYLLIFIIALLILIFSFRN